MPDHTPAPSTAVLCKVLESYRSSQPSVSRKVIYAACAELHALVKEIAALRQRGETADADTARLDALEGSRAWPCFIRHKDHWRVTNLLNKESPNFSGPTLRAAIDAARTALTGDALNASPTAR